MATKTENNYFAELYAVNVTDRTEKKNGLTYLSWAWAWAEIKKRHPYATYTVYERGDGTIYWTDGKTCWVKTGLTIDGLEHIEYLPVMDYKNRSIPLEAVTSMDVNKAIQRSLTKAAARHGLGLYIYAGEDLPEDESGTDQPQKPEPKDPVPFCARCGKKIIPVKNSKGEFMSAERQIDYSMKEFGAVYCLACSKQEYEMRLKEQEENDA